MKNNQFHLFCSASKGGDEEAQKVKAAVFSNIALCHLKLKNFYEVKKAVSELIQNIVCWSEDHIKMFLFKYF